MDRVTIMLQNKQLIEEIINSSEETKAKIHAAIIDGVSKRIVKNVVTNMDDSIKGAIEQAQGDLLKKFTENKREGWKSYYKLKQEYAHEIDFAVRKAWSEEIDRSINEWKKEVAKTYEKRLQSAYNEFIIKIQTLTYNLDDKIKEAVDKNIRARFK